MQEQRILIREITNLQNGFLWEMFFFSHNNDYFFCRSTKNENAFNRGNGGILYVRFDQIQS